MMDIKTKEEYNQNQKELINRYNSLKTKKKAGGEIESYNPENDKLIAQIDDFFLYNLNNSYRGEKHKKEIELKFYMRFDKIENTADFIKINALSLWKLQHNLNSNSLNYIVPFVYTHKGKSCIGVDLDLENFIGKLKLGKIKITGNFYINLEENYNIVRIAHTIKDRIKEANLPIILKSIQYTEDRIDSKKSTKEVRTTVILPDCTYYDPIFDQCSTNPINSSFCVADLKLEYGEPIRRWFWQKLPKVAENIESY